MIQCRDCEYWVGEQSWSDEEPPYRSGWCYPAPSTKFADPHEGDEEHEPGVPLFCHPEPKQAGSVGKAERWYRR